MSNYQLEYKYSLKWDLEWAKITLKKRRWLKEKKLVFFLPNILRMIKLWFKKPECFQISTNFPITCYWISSGTWGAYRPPNKIFICPYKIPDLEKVIRHEITHLEYNEKIINMSHEDKEKFINKKEAKDFNY